MLRIDEGASAIDQALDGNASGLTSGPTSGLTSGMRIYASDFRRLQHHVSAIHQTAERLLQFIKTNSINLIGLNLTPRSSFGKYSS